MGRIVILIAIVGLIAIVLMRLRSARQGWLERARLAGQWRAERDEGVALLELRGGPARGDYVEIERSGSKPERVEEGEWWVEGSTLCLRPLDGQLDRCELRVFGDGSIGLDSARRQGRVYRRGEGNVVPLRRS